VDPLQKGHAEVSYSWPFLAAARKSPYPKDLWRETCQLKMALAAKFKRLKKVGNAAIRKGSRIAAKIIAASVKATVPVATGAMKASLKVRALPRSRRYVGTRAVFEGVYYLGFVEYGTKHARGKRFYHRSEEAVKGQAMSTFISTIKGELDRQ
jgi:HK97 gp10 family phage protein